MTYDEMIKKEMEELRKRRASSQNNDSNQGGNTALIVFCILLAIGLGITIRLFDHDLYVGFVKCCIVLILGVIILWGMSLRKKASSPDSDSTDTTPREIDLDTLLDERVDKEYIWKKYIFAAFLGIGYLVSVYFFHKYLYQPFVTDELNLPQLASLKVFALVFAFPLFYILERINVYVEEFLAQIHWKIVLMLFYYSLGMFSLFKLVSVKPNMEIIGLILILICTAFLAGIVFAIHKFISPIFIKVPGDEIWIYNGLFGIKRPKWAGIRIIHPFFDKLMRRVKNVTFTANVKTPDIKANLGISTSGNDIPDLVPIIFDEISYAFVFNPRTRYDAIRYVRLIPAEKDEAGAVEPHFYNQKEIDDPANAKAMPAYAENMSDVIQQGIARSVAPKRDDGEKSDMTYFEIIRYRSHLVPYIRLLLLNFIWDKNFRPEKFDATELGNRKIKKCLKRNMPFKLTLFQINKIKTTEELETVIEGKAKAKLEADKTHAEIQVEVEKANKVIAATQQAAVKYGFIDHEMFSKDPKDLTDEQRRQKREGIIQNKILNAETEARVEAAKRDKGQNFFLGNLSSTIADMVKSITGRTS